jgi:hypothetical protein
MKRVADFAAFLESQGFALKGPPIFDDQFHRCDLTAKNGKGDGGYKVTLEDGRAFGWWRNYQIHTWSCPI